MSAGGDLYVIKCGSHCLYWGWPEHYWVDGGLPRWALRLPKADAEKLASATPGAQIEKWSDELAEGEEQ